MKTRTLSNADVLNMKNSGIGDQTIILSIEHSPSSFDTSPEALIGLKRQGVTDAVLNAMLRAVESRTAKTVSTTQDGCALLDKVLDAYANRETLMSTRAVRIKSRETITTQSGTASITRDVLLVYPDKIRIEIQPSVGPIQKMTVGPDFDYMTVGSIANRVPGDVLTDVRSFVRLDPINIAQHRADYSCVSEGAEQIGEVAAAKINIISGGAEVRLSIDPASGRVLRSRRSTLASGEAIGDFSGWRMMNGLNVASVQHRVDSKRTTDTTIISIELNPLVDSGLFQLPVPAPQLFSSSFTFKVLQAESVPYTVQAGGGISTNCSISGSTTTSLNSYSYGNITTGTAVSTPNLSMNCDSYDNSLQWRHVLNAMLVEASDGNAYIIACDAAWRWSKCRPLRAGDVFTAKRSDKGFVVQYLDSKSKEKEATYTVLQSKALH